MNDPNEPQATDAELQNTIRDILSMVEWLEQLDTLKHDRFVLVSKIETGHWFLRPIDLLQARLDDAKQDLLEVQDIVPADFVNWYVYAYALLRVSGFEITGDTIYVVWFGETGKVPWLEAMTQLTFEELEWRFRRMRDERDIDRAEATIHHVKLEIFAREAIMQEAEERLTSEEFKRKYCPLLAGTADDIWDLAAVFGPLLLAGTGAVTMPVGVAAGMVLILSRRGVRHYCRGFVEYSPSSANNG